VIVYIEVESRKANGVYRAKARVPLHDGGAITATFAEGRSPSAAAASAVKAAMAVILAEMALGRLAWNDYETITFRWDQ
jgi:hypothetical protein